MQGYIYCLTNTTIPQLVKIGKTGRNPETRAAEISASTGVATPFKIEWSRRVRDMNLAERELHAALRQHRLNKRREFFQCTAGQAFTAAKNLGSFHSKGNGAPAGRQQNSKRSDKQLGLSLTAVTLIVFSGAIAFDLDTSTIATTIAAMGITLSMFFQITSKQM